LGSEETCNGIDDDCDGLIDEGQLNDCGQCGEEPEEICDGIDNDCDGLTDEDIVKTCQSQCGMGYQVCLPVNCTIADGLGCWTECSVPKPQEEICDGLDNDCDGLIDEDLNCGSCTPEMLNKLLPCQEAPLKCGQGFQRCTCTGEDCEEMKMTECAQECVYDETVPCSDILTDEICNNHDDNCNGQTDEGLTKFCYDGPLETLNVGICKGGYQTCFEGEWGIESLGHFFPDECPEQVLPKQYETCDGSDETCDGEVDGGQTMIETDILFIIDFSGSMTQEINAVFGAMNLFAENYKDNESLKWGLIGGPVKVPFPGFFFVGLELLELMQDLTGFTAFINNLPDLGDIQTGGHEMLIDAIWLALAGDVSQKEWHPTVLQDSVPTLQDFKVSWRPEAKKLIIVWSDELPQSFLAPKLLITELTEQIKNTPDLSIYVFTKNGLFGWSDIIDAAPDNGKKFNLTTDAYSMYDDLLTILDEAVCVDP
jgi:hypothetical protein